MDSERWQHLADLLADALERPSSERRFFLERRCGEDLDLLAEALAYLEEDEDSGFLAKPAFSLQRSPGEDPHLGRRLGGYRLESLLGSGGMGSVYKALRVDGPFEREVAIKVLRRGFASNELLARFRAEQAILARLEHPGIARLIDGDVAEDGSPFFVLELVDGEPIDAYCERIALPLVERVKLLAKVCDAVGEAHRHLVVHRDLKPANVLVSAQGEPKLLDFGIAKWLSSDASELTQDAGIGPMTPDFASPEQKAGGAITTATDIYALGVLGHLLLKGFRPDSAADEKKAEALPWQGRLPSDLRTILGKALAAEPAQRYATVEDLADDLRRFLDGRPVKAHPESFLYVATRLARRHAVATTALAAALAIILVFAGVMTWQRGRIARQAAEITQERDRAEAVLEFLVDFLRSPDPSRARGETLTVREALKAAEERLEREESDPATRAALFEAVGDVYRNLALFEEARPPLEKALDLQRALDPQGEKYANALHDLALLERHEDQGEKAAKLMAEALGIQRRLWPEGKAELARGINNFASLQLELGRTDEAEALAREGLGMKERLLGPGHPDVATSLNTLATIVRKRGDLASAEALYRRCLELRRRELVLPDPQLAKAINNLAGVLLERKQFDEAGQLYEEALKLRRQLFPDGEHPDVVTSLNNLAMLEKDRGRLEIAEKLLREAVEVARRKGLVRLLPTLEKNLASVADAGSGPATFSKPTG